MIENILIFKTNISHGERINGIKHDFEANKNITRWYLDLDDIDNVLKVQTDSSIKEKDIITIVKSNGFHCEILTD